MKLGLACRVAQWMLAAALLVVASNPKSPYLMPIRGMETALVVLVGGLGMVVAFRRARAGRTGRIEHGLMSIVLASAMAIGIVHELRFRSTRADVLTDDVAARHLGQHFVVGYTNFDEVATLARRGLIGGIYLSRHNVRGKSATQMRSEIDKLQAMRATAALPPLIVAADQEGGRVAHMSPPLDPLPPLGALVKTGSDRTLEARARAYGAVQGQGLAALGINLNLGPVVDLRPNEGGPVFDTHTRIGERAIGGDPVVVGRVAHAYGEGLMTQGVRPTLKHFPGLGRVTVDTHHFAGQVPTRKAVLAESDWLPFRHGAVAGSAIMLGHVVVPDIDPSLPASLSEAVVQGLLRRDWGFSGLLITDDLNMGAIFRRGICDSAVSALKAGVDLLLVSYDPDQYYGAMHCAAAALRDGLLDTRRLAASRERIGATLSPMP